ncbi:transposase [Austwickia sp. TVS 96-490-7B]|uniref:transposase n=1 Tax=Austwickia sp. TVS 96-490-7B TaxID=2830843 RepID=UPI001C57D111|nr:transposase [Austwickia sp. TVS 96-490-7B]
MEGSTDSEVFIGFLEKLNADVGTLVYLVVDGHLCHASKITKKWIEGHSEHIALFTLPPYSPELNPNKWAWKNVKHDQIRKQLPVNKRHLWELCEAALAALKNSLATVRGFSGILPWPILRSL